MVYIAFEPLYQLYSLLYISYKTNKQTNNQKKPQHKQPGTLHVIISTQLLSLGPGWLEVTGVCAGEVDWALWAEVPASSSHLVKKDIRQQVFLMVF